MQRGLRILFFILVVKPLLGGFVGVNVFGREHLPRDGRQCILIANHNSHLDAFALLNLFPLKNLHRVHPVAAADYFLQGNRILAWFALNMINIVPIPRSGFTRTNNPLTRMGAILEAGDSLIIFPEGTRGEPEQMVPFKAGIAHLIRKYPDVPVIPVHLKDLGRTLPKGEFVPVPFFCDLRIGAPVVVEGGREDAMDILERAVRDLGEVSPPSEVAADDSVPE